MMISTGGFIANVTCKYLVTPVRRVHAGVRGVGPGGQCQGWCGLGPRDPVNPPLAYSALLKPVWEACRLREKFRKPPTLSCSSSSWRSRRLGSRCCSRSPSCCRRRRRGRRRRRRRRPCWRLTRTASMRRSPSTRSWSSSSTPRGECALLCSATAPLLMSCACWVRSREVGFGGV